jgi:hypothetical protein
MVDTNFNRYEGPEDDVGKQFLAALSMLGRKKGSMPLKGFCNIPMFTGRNINGFLERYNAIADDFEVSDDGRVKGLVHYLQEDGEKNILQFVRSLPEWEERDWDGIQTVLRQTFLEDFRQAVMYTIEDLRKITSKNRRISSLKDLADYYFEYKVVADYLKKTEEITLREHAMFFFKGLPQAIRYALEAKEKSNPDRDPKKNVFRLETVYFDCQELFQSEGAYTHANITCDKPELHFRRQHENARISRDDDIPQVKRNSVRVSKVEEDSSDSGMEQLMKMMEKMRVEFGELKTSVAEKARPTRDGPTRYAGPTGANATPIGNREIRKCIYDGCDKRKSECDASSPGQ